MLIVKLGVDVGVFLLGGENVLLVLLLDMVTDLELVQQKFVFVVVMSKGWWRYWWQ